MKKVLTLLLASWLLVPTLALAQPAGPTAEAAGVIQELNFGSSSMVVDGLSYEVAPDVDVEIGGSYGAFTMLAPGMRIYYEYQRLSPTSRVITVIRELPADVAFKES